MSESTINIEAGRAWVKALREPGRRQIQSVLERTYESGDVMGHCCLGVACRTAMGMEDGGLPDLKVKRAKTGTSVEFGEDQHSGILPWEVIEWLGIPKKTDVPSPFDEGDFTGLSFDGDLWLDITGLSHRRPAGLEGVTTVRATVLNDVWGWSFDEIADAVENTWPELREQKLIIN